MSDADQAQLGGLLALGGTYVGDRSLEDVLQRVAELAREAVSGSDRAGITMLDDGRPQASAVTDETLADFERDQYGLETGQAFVAYSQQRALLVTDVAGDAVWTGFGDAAHSYGIGSMLSIPLVMSGTGIGVLNLYSGEAEGLGQIDETIVAQVGRLASVVVANAQAMGEARNLSEQLKEAMKSRAAIEQAKGIIMSQEHCDADQAFQVLVTASQRANRKVRTLAEELVAKTQHDG